MNKEDLIKFLESEELVELITTKLLSGVTNHVVRYPRVAFPPHVPDMVELEDMKDSMGEEEFQCLLEEGAFDPETYGLHRRDTLLTGAAVAAVICEKLWGVPAVINDVDLFYYQLNSRTGESVDSELYENIVDEQFSYRIHRNRRKGLLNLVKIIPGSDFSLRKIIDSFDLTYAKVGVILGEKKLMYTDEFVEFLLTKTMKIGALNDTDHMLTSYIRGVQKAKDFQCNFYLGDYMRDFFEENESVFKTPDFAFGAHTSRVNLRQYYNKTLDEALFVTEKRMKVWEADLNLLSPWASLVLCDEEKVKHRIRFHVPNEPWANFYGWLFRSYSKANEYAETFYSGLINVRPEIRVQNNHWFENLKAVLEGGLSSDPRFWSNLFCNKRETLSLFKESFSIKKLESLKEFLESHKEFTENNRRLVEFNYSISEMIEFYLAASKLPLYALGMIETLLQYRRNVWDREIESPRKEAVLKLIEAKNYASLAKLCEEFRMEDFKKTHLVDPTNIKPFSSWVREICDTVTLDAEGKNMRHCVAGYGNQIKTGRSRIFHLEVKGHPSTLEIHFSKETFAPRQIPEKYRTPEALKKQAMRSNLQSHFKYSINQHKAICNSIPYKGNRVMAQRLLNYLNGELTVKESKEKVRENLADYMALLVTFD